MKRFYLLMNVVTILVWTAQTSVSAQTDVTGYETVTVSIPATGYDASAGAPQMARVKYNKTFPLVITSDDMGKTEITNNWAAFNGYPVHVDKGGFPTGDDYLSTPYSATYATNGSDLANYKPLTYTDDTGGTHRFTATSAIWPQSADNTNYTLMNATDAKTMLRTGWSFAQHDVDEATDAATIASRFATLSSDWATKTGSAGLKVMVEPNGDKKYIAAGISSSEVCWNIFQNASTEYPNLSLALDDWAAARSDWTETGLKKDYTTFSSKPIGANERLFFQGHETEWQNKVNAALTNNDGSNIILGGTHGIGTDIMAHLRDAVQPADKAWVASADEVWEYYHIYNNAYIDNVSWSGEALSFNLHVPTYAKSMFRELTINIPGLKGGPSSTDGTVTTAGGATVVTGGYKQNDSRFTLNLGLESRYLDYIDQLTALYRNNPSNLFVKRDAQYLIDQLWPGDTKTAKQAALDASFDYTYSINAVLKDGGNTVSTSILKSGALDTAADVTYSFPRYIVCGGTLYEATANATVPYYGGTLSVGEPGVELNITYSKTGKDNVVLMEEGENLDGIHAIITADYSLNDKNKGTYWGMANTSGAKSGSVTNGKPVTVATLPSGKYTITTAVQDSYMTRDGSPYYFHLLVDGDEVATFVNSGQQKIEEFSTEVSIYNDDTPVTITNSSTHGEASCIDYVYIQLTGALPPAVTLTASPTTRVYVNDDITLTANAVLRGNSSLSSVEFQKKVDDGEWTDLATVTSGLASGDDITQTFTPDATGTYQFRARATDNGTLTSDWMETNAITVTNDMNTVTLASSSDASPVVGSTVTLTATATPAKGSTVTYLAIEKSTDSGTSWTPVGDVYGTAPIMASAPRKVSSVNEGTGEATVTYSFTAVAGETAQYRANAIIGGNALNSEEAEANGGDGSAIALTTTTPAARKLTFTVYKPDGTVESNVSATTSASTISYDAELATIFSSDTNLKPLMRQYCNYTFYSDAALTNAITIADGQISGDAVYVKWTYTDNAPVFSTGTDATKFQYYAFINNSNKYHGSNSNTSESTSYTQTNVDAITKDDTGYHWAFWGTPYSFKIYNRKAQKYLYVASVVKNASILLSSDPEVSHSSFHLPYRDWTSTSSANSWGQYNGNFIVLQLTEQAGSDGYLNICSNQLKKNVSDGAEQYSRMKLAKVLVPLNVYVDAAGSDDGQSTEVLLTYPGYNSSGDLTSGSETISCTAEGEMKTAIDALQSHDYSFYKDAACETDFPSSVSIFGGSTQAPKVVYALYESTNVAITASSTTTEEGSPVTLTAAATPDGGTAITYLAIEQKGDDDTWTPVGTVYTSSSETSDDWTKDGAGKVTLTYKFKAEATGTYEFRATTKIDDGEAQTTASTVTITATEPAPRNITFKLYRSDDTAETNASEATANSQTYGTELSTVMPSTLKRQYCDYTFYSDAAFTTEITELKDDAFSNSTVYVKWSYSDNAPVFSTGEDADEFQYYVIENNSNRLNGMDADGTKITDSASLSETDALNHWAFVGTPYNFKIYNRGKSIYLQVADDQKKKSGAISFTTDASQATEWQMTDIDWSINPNGNTTDYNWTSWGAYNGNFFQAKINGTNNVYLANGSVSTDSHRWTRFRLDQIVLPLKVYEGTAGNKDEDQQKETVVAYPTYSYDTETGTLSLQSGKADTFMKSTFSTVVATLNSNHTYAYYHDADCTDLFGAEDVESIFGGATQALKAMYALYTDESITFHLYDNNGTDMNLSATTSNGDLATQFAASGLARRFCQYSYYSDAALTTEATSEDKTVYVKWQYTDDAPVFSTGTDADEYQYYTVTSYDNYLYVVESDGTYGPAKGNDWTNEHYWWALIGTPYGFKMYNKATGRYYSPTMTPVTYPNYAIGIADTFEEANEWDLPMPSGDKAANVFQPRAKNNGQYMFQPTWTNPAPQDRSLGHIIVQMKVYKDDKATVVDQQTHILAYPTTGEVLQTTMLTQTTTNNKNPWRHAFCDYSFYSDEELAAPVPNEGTSIYGGKEQQRKAIYATYTVDEETFGLTYLFGGGDNSYFFANDSGTLGESASKSTAKDDQTNAYRWQLVGDPYNLQIRNLKTGDTYRLGCKVSGIYQNEPNTTKGDLLMMTGSGNYRNFYKWEAISESYDPEASQYDVKFYLLPTTVSGTTYNRYEDGILQNKGSLLLVGSTGTDKTSCTLFRLTIADEQRPVTWHVKYDPKDVQKDISASSLMEAASLRKPRVTVGNVLELGDMPQSLRRHYCDYTMYSDAECTTLIDRYTVSTDAEQHIYVKYTLTEEAPTFYAEQPVTAEGTDWYEMFAGTKSYLYDSGTGTLQALMGQEPDRNDGTEYVKYQWVLVGTPYGVTLRDRNTDNYLTAGSGVRGADIPLTATATTWELLDNYDGTVAALHQKDGSVYVSGNGRALLTNNNGDTNVEFLAAEGLVKLTFKLHYGANTLRPGSQSNGTAQGETENIVIDEYQSVKKNLLSVLGRQWQRAYCDYTFTWDGNPVTHVTKEMVEAYKAAGGSADAGTITIDVNYTVDSDFKWSQPETGTALTSADKKYWYYVHRSNMANGIFRYGSTQIVGNGNRADRLYTYDYEWCVTGDPYGFRLLCHYDPDDTNLTYLNVSGAAGNENDEPLMDTSGDRNLYEMRLPSANSNRQDCFWFHPIYTNDLKNEQDGGTRHYVAINGMSTSAELHLYSSTDDIALFYLQDIDHTIMAEYVRYAGFVGALSNSAFTGNEKLQAIRDRIKTETDGGSKDYADVLTDDDFAAIKEAISLEDNMVQMKQGYYRIILRAAEKSETTTDGDGNKKLDFADKSRLYFKGCDDETKKDGTTGGYPTTLTTEPAVAEYTPATIFFFDQRGAEAQKTRYKLRVNSLNLNRSGNFLMLAQPDDNSETAALCRYEDIGGAMTQIMVPSDGSSNVNYFGVNESQEGARLVEVFHPYHGSYLYLQPVGLGENEMPFKMKLNKGHEATSENETLAALPYTYTSIYVPYDLEIAGGIDADGEEITDAEACDALPFVGTHENYHWAYSEYEDAYYKENEYSLLCQSIDTHNKGDYRGRRDFIPAGTPVIFRSKSGMQEVTFRIPTTEPSASLSESIEGTYLKKADSREQIYVFGKESYTKAGSKVYTGRVGFFPRASASSLLTNNKAYYVSPDHGGSAKQVMFMFETAGEEALGITTVRPEGGVRGAYDLQGRKVERIGKPGLYIVNGRKVVIK